MCTSYQSLACMVLLVIVVVLCCKSHLLVYLFFVLLIIIINIIIFLSGICTIVVAIGTLDMAFKGGRG